MAEIVIDRFRADRPIAIHSVSHAAAERISHREIVARAGKSRAVRKRAAARRNGCRGGYARLTEGKTAGRIEKQIVHRRKAELASDGAERIQFLALRNAVRRAE